MCFNQLEVISLFNQALQNNRHQTLRIVIGRTSLGATPWLTTLSLLGRKTVLAWSIICGRSPLTSHLLMIKAYKSQKAGGNLDKSRPVQPSPPALPFMSTAILLKWTPSKSLHRVSWHTALATSCLPISEIEGPFSSARDQKLVQKSQIWLTASWREAHAPSEVWTLTSTQASRFLSHWPANLTSPQKRFFQQVSLNCLVLFSAVSSSTLAERMAEMTKRRLQPWSPSWSFWIRLPQIRSIFRDGPSLFLWLSTLLSSYNRATRFRSLTKNISPLVKMGLHLLELRRILFMNAPLIPFCLRLFLASK